MTEKARWIASYPKSGNTWVRCFIEAYFTDQLNINYLQCTKADCHGLDYQNVMAMELSRYKPMDTIWYRNAALMNQIVREPTIFKTHMANVEVQGVKVIPPGLTHSAVYLVRDPRAIAVSWSNHADRTLGEVIHQFGEERTFLTDDKVLGHFTSTWQKHVQSWEKADFPVLRVRYEDLVEDREHWFAEILKNFNYKVDPNKLRKAIKLCDLANLKKQESKNKFRECLNQDKFFGASKDWKEVLSDLQIKQIELVNNEYMVKLGYLKEN